MHFHQDFFFFFFWRRHMFARFILIGTTPLLLRRCVFWEVTGTIELAALTHNRDTAVPPLCRETLRWRFKHLHPHLHLRCLSSPAQKHRQRKPKHRFLISSLHFLHLSAFCSTHTHTHKCKVYASVHKKNKSTRTQSTTETSSQGSDEHMWKCAPHLFQKKFLLCPSHSENSWGHEDGKSSCFSVIFEEFLRLWVQSGIWARGVDGFHLSCILCWQKTELTGRQLGNNQSPFLFNFLFWPTYVSVNLLTLG